MFLRQVSPAAIIPFGDANLELSCIIPLGMVPSAPSVCSSSD